MFEVSIVIPTYNRLTRLRQVIEALHQQDYDADSFELVVVSDGSEDGTNEYLQTLETPFALKVYLAPNGGPASARNRGLSQASGDYILFLDDDVVPVPSLISEHMAWHNIHEDVAVIGPMVTPPDYRPSPWVRWMHDRLAEQYEAMTEGLWQPTARQFYTGNASIARRHLVESGGFDPTFKRAEDVELAYRLLERGLRFLFNPRAIGYHYEKRSYASWQAIANAYGRNDVIFSQEKGQQWLLDTMQREFETRNPLQRWLIRLCLDRSFLSRLVSEGCRLTGSLSARLNLSFLQRFAYSTIFNLQYYQGAANALGGHCYFLFGGDQSAPVSLARRNI